jgi:pyochelin synthetase
MLEGPTVAKLASQLAGAESAHDGAGARPNASPLVHLGGAGEAPLRVLVHDASGTLASYDSLLALLAEHGPLAGLVVQDVEAYLGVQSAVLVERMATDYARLLAAEGHDRVHLVGYDAGGVLAAEVARQLTEAGATVESLTVVAALPWPCRVDDELLVEYLFAAGARVDPVRLGFPAEAALGRALQHVLADTPERVPDGRLAGLTGEAELEGVAWCFRRLAERSPEDRLAAIARALAPPGAEPAAPGQVATLYDLFRHSLRAFTLHEVTPYAGDVVLLRPSDDPPLRPGLGEETTRFWRRRCLGELTVVDLAGDPRTCLGPGRAARVSEVLAAGSRR